VRVGVSEGEGEGRARVRVDHVPNNITTNACSCNCFVVVFD
jgi:hypothetical protein